VGVFVSVLTVTLEPNLSASVEVEVIIESFVCVIGNKVDGFTVDV